MKELNVEVSGMDVVVYCSSVLRLCDSQRKWDEYKRWRLGGEYERWRSKAGSKSFLKLNPAAGK